MTTSPDNNQWGNKLILTSFWLYGYLHPEIIGVFDHNISHIKYILTRNFSYR
jgi:hypothetical protein